MTRRAPDPFVDWAVATRTHPDQAESGDRHVVATREGGVLLAAVDGLGHGAEAAAAACAAVALLEANAEEPLVELVRRCHPVLAATRGVVMSIAWLDAREGALAWLGVGNVGGLLLHPRPGSDPLQRSLLLRGGVVGYQLPELLAEVVAVARGDLLVFATDGVRPDFAKDVDPAAPPRAIADRILAEHASTSDDALALVVRFRRREA